MEWSATIDRSINFVRSYEGVVEKTIFVDYVPLTKHFDVSGLNRRKFEVLGVTFVSSLPLSISFRMQRMHW